MALGTWWKGDPLPDLPALPAFSVRRSADRQLIARLTALSEQEISARFQTGNYAYLAFLNEIPVAYGWVATREGGVLEIQLHFNLSSRDRYLWDFQTLPEWRGRGVYPHFLQTIIRQEMQFADRFWIFYEPGNKSAARSISKAGFGFFGDFSITEGRVTGIILFEDSERASTGAQLLNLPVVAVRQGRS